MAEQFELFRLSLLQRQQHDLVGVELRDLSREEWLRKAFLEKQPFSSYGSDYYYVPATEHSENNAIIGRVGRHVLREENKPPEEGLEDFMHETWIASLLVIDPTDHNDGQKLAIQNVTDVGTPEMLISRLVSAINTRYPQAPYSIEAAHITEAREFWDFVKENQGNITSVTFDLNAPNMFGGSDNWDEDLRNLRDQEKAKKIQLSVQNDEGGINPETDRMKSAVKYATRGGGTIKARARGSKKFSSQDTVKRVYIDSIKETGSELVKVAAQLVNRILGRE